MLVITHCHFTLKAGYYFYTSLGWFLFGSWGFFHFHMLNYRKTKSTKPTGLYLYIMLTTVTLRTVTQRTCALDKTTVSSSFLGPFLSVLIRPVIEIGVVTWKMWIDWETPHLCSKTEIVSQFPCAVLTVLTLCFERSPEQVWAASLVLGQPCTQPTCDLGHCCPARCTALPAARATTKTAILLHHHTHELQSTSRSSGLQHFKRIRRTQGSQRAPTGSGNSFLHFTKNASLGID